jgi:Tfp pilus assembly protein PilF
MAAMFIIFSAPTHFLGDGYSALSNISSGSGTFYKWSEKGITLILTSIQSIIGDKNEQSALTAYQIVSVISGVVSIWFFFLIAEYLTKINEKRIIAFFVLLISSVLLLFIGYVENYPQIWISITGFTYFGLRYIARGYGWYYPLLFLAYGVFIHLQMAVLIPVYIFLIFCTGLGLTVFKRFKSFLIALAGILFLAAFILFFKKYKSDLYFENIFLPLFSGKPIDAGYFVLSLPHLIDILNQFLLLSPLLPVLIIHFFRKPDAIIKNKVNTFLALIAFFSFLFILFIDPKLSMPRDWDLFSFVPFGLTLLCISLISDNHIESIKSLIPSLTMFLVVACLPYLLVNLNRDSSIEYFKYIIRLDPKKSQSGLVTMREYYKEKGNMAIVDSLDYIFYKNYHLSAKIDSVFAFLGRNNIDQAIRVAKSISPDKFSSVYHNMLAVLNLRLGKIEEALNESNKAIQLQQYNPILYCNRALIEIQNNNKDGALKNLKRGYELNNEYTEIIKALVTIYFENNILDSASHYADRLIQIDSSNGNGYYMLCYIYHRKGNLDSLRIYKDLYKKYGKSDKAYHIRIEELSNLK